MLLPRAVPGRAGAHSSLAVGKPSGVGIEPLPVETRVVLSGGWPPGAVCPVAANGSRPEGKSSAKTVTTFETRKENHYGCANRRPDSVAE